MPWVSYKAIRYCWPTSCNVLGVLFLGDVSSAFCLQRRHVGHTNFGTWGLANSIPSFVAPLCSLRGGFHATTPYAPGVSRALYSLAPGAGAPGPSAWDQSARDRRPAQVLPMR